MSFFDWLLGGRSKRVEAPEVHQLFAAGGVGGVLYADGRLRSWRLSTGEPVHDQRVTGPRVAWDGERLVDSQPADDGPRGWHGLPFFVRGQLLQVGKGELRYGELVIEEPWLQPSRLLRVDVAEDGRVALLDPFSNRPVVLHGDRLTRLEGRDLPVMGGCFVGEELHVVREGAVERYDKAGLLLGQERPHALQTLLVTPKATLGLDERDRLELRQGERVETFGPAPETPELQTGAGVLLATRGGFVVDDHAVEIEHQGLLECDEGVLVASWPPALYDRRGRCLRTLEPVKD